MNQFALHNDPCMGIYLEESTDVLYGTRLVEWAFTLGDDEMSNAYRAWREQQVTPDGN